MPTTHKHSPKRDISIPLIQAGLDPRSTIGRTFQFDFDEESIQGKIRLLHVDKHFNFEINVSRPWIGGSKKIRSLKWSAAEKKWRLYYDATGEFPGVKNIPGVLTLL